MTMKRNKYLSISCFGVLSAIVISLMFTGCPSPVEPGIVPPRPVWMAGSHPPSPDDHGIYPDLFLGWVDLEWHSDPSLPTKTSGYLIFRSTSDSVEHQTGLLKNRTQIG